MKLLSLVLLSIFRMVVIPVQFADTKFTTGIEELSASVNIAENYFRSQPSSILPGSPDQGQVEFIIAPVVSVSENLSHYGSNYVDRKDVLLHEAVREAIRLSVTSIDFSLLDNDADGIVDNIHLIVAGESESDGGEPHTIWPQHDLLSNHGSVMSAGGKAIDSFTITTEHSSAGTICHELGHFLGLTDMYDTDGEGSGGLSSGLRSTSLMDDGCKNGEGVTPPNISALDLDAIGLKATPVTKKAYTLHPVSDGGDFLILNSNNSDEYYLLECRQSTGWDKFIGGSGLVAYHIDKSSEAAGWSDILNRTISAKERWEYGMVNNNPTHECAKLLTGPSDDGSSRAVFFLDNGYTGIGQLDGPEFSFWDGSSSHLAVKDIHTNNDGSVTFEVIEPITIDGSIIHQDGITLKWRTDFSEEDISSYEIIWTDGRRNGTGTALAESRSFSIGGLSPKQTYTATVTILLKNGLRYRNSTCFTTKFYQKDSYPYIYLGANGQTMLSRNKDGSFIKGTRIPLKVYNAPDAMECLWYYDSKPITTDLDGLYTLERSGVLKAQILHDNGAWETIEKEITVR